MAMKQVDRLRCDDCGTQNEIWIPLTMGGDNLVWCCRSCGSELSRPVVQPETLSLRTIVVGPSADVRLQRVH